MRIRSLVTLAAVLAFPFATFSAPPVAIIEDAPWSPGDAPRDGASEFGVLLQLAQLQQQHPLIGLVGVGDRRGVFQEGTRRGLAFAVQQGVPVVRLARGAPIAVPIAGDVFIDGGMMTAEAASALLAQCLERFGPLPKLDATSTSTADTSRAFSEKLARYQAEFTARQPARVAMR